MAIKFKSYAGPLSHAREQGLPVINSDDMKVGDIGVIVGNDSNFRGHVILRVWCSNDNETSFVSLTDPDKTFTNMNLGWEVLPVRMKAEVLFGGLVKAQPRSEPLRRKLEV